MVSIEINEKQYNPDNQVCLRILQTIFFIYCWISTVYFQVAIVFVNASLKSP